MGDDFRTSFLTYYIRSLGERTRDEKRGTKLGFDWIIYNLALAEDWSPHRLPFLRGRQRNVNDEDRTGIRRGLCLSVARSEDASRLRPQGRGTQQHELDGPEIRHRPAQCECSRSHPARACRRYPGRGDPRVQQGRGPDWCRTLRPTRRAIRDAGRRSRVPAVRPVEPDGHRWPGTGVPAGAITAAATVLQPLLLYLRSSLTSGTGQTSGRTS